MTMKEEDEDPRKINILETEGHCEVEGPQLENQEITMPLKIRHVNIGTEAEPKLTNIRDYWDDATVDKVIEFLHEYQDLFPMKLHSHHLSIHASIIKIVLVRDPPSYRRSAHCPIQILEAMLLWHFSLECIQKVISIS